MIHDVDQMLADQGKGNPDGLRTKGAKDDVRPDVDAEAFTGRDFGFRGSAPCRHHHGRQRPLGGGARVAAREGHRRGVEALRRTVRAAGELGIDILTIFAFSSENWSRPQSEIRDLIGLLRRFIRNDLADLHKNNVRVRIIGERDGLDADVRRLLEEAEELTRRQRRPDAGRRLQLRRAPGDRARGAPAGRGESRPVRSIRPTSPPNDCRRLSRCRRSSGSGSDHPHQRRAAAVEFSAVAIGL